MLYVHFNERRSESCNQTFIDLEFQNFNIFISIYLYAKFYDPAHPV